jgi:hypothetical protein
LSRLGLWENRELNDAVLAGRVGEMVVTTDASRGFFVVSLAVHIQLMDRLLKPVLVALRAAGDGVEGFTVCHMAMSAETSPFRRSHADLCSRLVLSVYRLDAETES